MTRKFFTLTMLACGSMLYSSSANLKPELSKFELTTKVRELEKQLNANLETFTSFQTALDNAFKKASEFDTRLKDQAYALDSFSEATAEHFKKVAESIQASMQEIKKIEEKVNQQNTECIINDQNKIKVLERILDNVLNEFDTRLNKHDADFETVFKNLEDISKAGNANTQHLKERLNAVEVALPKIQEELRLQKFLEDNRIKFSDNRYARLTEKVTSLSNKVTTTLTALEDLKNQLQQTQKESSKSRAQLKMLQRFCCIAGITATTATTYAAVRTEKGKNWTHAACAFARGLIPARNVPTPIASIAESATTTSSNS